MTEKKAKQQDKAEDQTKSEAKTEQEPQAKQDDTAEGAYGAHQDFEGHTAYTPEDVQHIS